MNSFSTTGSSERKLPGELEAWVSPVPIWPTALVHGPSEVGELGLGVPRAMEPNRLCFIYLFSWLIKNCILSSSGRY